MIFIVYSIRHFDSFQCGEDTWDSPIFKLTCKSISGTPSIIIIDSDTSILIENSKFSFFDLKIGRSVFDISFDNLRSTDIVGCTCSGALITLDDYNSNVYYAESFIIDMSTKKQFNR